MAGVVDPRFSALYGDASKWLEAAPDYDAVIAKVGAADGAGVLAKSACMTALLNLAVRSPTVVAFVLASDPDLIHVGHSCTRYPANISKPSAVDHQFIVLVGDREDSCEPIAIDDDGFSRGAATRCHSVDEIRGNQGHAATPAVLRRASPAGGTAGSDTRVEPASIPVQTTKQNWTNQQLNRQKNSQFEAHNFASRTERNS